MSVPRITRPAEAGQPVVGHDSADQAPAGRQRSPSALVLLIGAVLTIAAAGMIWLVLPHGSTHSDGATAAHATVPVGYAVSGSGTAQITYTQPDGTSHTLTAHLPWQQTAALTTSSPAAVSIVLGPDGGHATCTLTLHGAPVQHATAYGTYGRATCTSPPPAQ